MQQANFNLFYENFNSDNAALIESNFYGLAAKVSDKYEGASWKFLTNDKNTFLIYPDDNQLHEVTSKNGVKRTLSAQGLGIFISQTLTSLLSSYCNKKRLETEAQLFSDLYYASRNCFYENYKRLGFSKAELLDIHALLD